MKTRVHFTWPDGAEDSIVLEADTFEDLQALAQEAVVSRNATNPWSEDVE